VTDCMAPAKASAVMQLTRDDERFLVRFAQCELPESEWTHLAHVRVAWLYLSTQCPDVALRSICDGILRYNTEVLRRPEKYSETVTVAFTRIVLGRMMVNEPWGSFATRIGDLLEPKTPVLLHYYSKEHLFSDEARTRFVESDLVELPCRDAFDLTPGPGNG